MSSRTSWSKEVQTSHDDRDDLSDAASSRAEEQTLNEEELPSYGNSEPNASSRAIPPEKQGHSLIPVTTSPATDTSLLYPPHPSPKPFVPTASAPFNFPTTAPIAELPAYTASTENRKPVAIPQITPSPTSPFLSAVPTNLLTYGITPESWLSFVDTTSAFLSANVSKQAVHHAADVASTISDYHKEYAANVKQGFKNIGKSAKHLNPVGMFGGFVGLTVGVAGHMVGSVLNAPLSMMKKPQTPRERALAYMATANKDWFHVRGLHAMLLDTSELASDVDAAPQELLGRARSCEGEGAATQMQALTRWISEIEIQTKAEDMTMASPLGMQATGSTSSSSTAVAMAGSSKAAGKKPENLQLQLAFNTLWLVLVHDKRAVAIWPDEKKAGFGS